MSQPRRIVLELLADFDADRIEGENRTLDGSTLHFAGWLEFAGAWNACGTRPARSTSRRKRRVGDPRAGRRLCTTAPLG